MPEEKGLLIVYTGPGKGKTTCALGTAFRAVGQGLRVLMVQFIKGSWHYGELDAAKMLGDDKFEIRPMGRGFVKIGGAETDPEDIKLARGVLGSGARRDLRREVRPGGAGRNQLHDQLQNAGRRRSRGGAEKSARARARHLHGAERASAACRAGRPRYGDARGETPLHQGYTGPAGYRLLVATRGGGPADGLTGCTFIGSNY